MDFVNEKLEEFNKFLDGKKVAIIGMGVSNVPLLDYFYDKNAKVTVFDKRNLSDEIMEKINKYRYEVEIGEDNLSRLHGYDVIFRSPSALPTTPEFVEEVERGALLTSEIEMVLKLAPCKVIGVTGTEGKTTTTSIIYEILKQTGRNCFLGGNIGKPIFTKVKDMRPDDIIVLELSSFQLMGMKVSPQISVITNISPNHLNVHKDYQEYIDSKKEIYLHQNEKGILVINKDNDITKEFYKDAPGKVRYFSHKELLDNGVIFDERDSTIKLCEDGVRKHLIKQKDMKLRGEHNCENACAAIAATLGLVNEDKCVSTIENFGGVEHRIEFVKEIDGVKWFNDSIGTSPTRTIAGLNSFEEKIVLIAGGYDKHLDYAPIAKPIVKNVSKLILMGATADKIEKAVKDELLKEGKTLPIYRCLNLQEVVNKAKEVAREGEVVLFSPASASFDLFKNFEDRGNKFKEEVYKL